MRRFISILIALSVVALAAIGALTAPQARLLLPAAAMPTRAAYLPAVFKPEQTLTPTAFPTAEATETSGPTETALPPPTELPPITPTSTEPPITPTPTETPTDAPPTETPTETNTPTVTQCPVLDAPALNASRSSSTVSLSWGSVSGAASYKVYRSSAGSSGAFSVIASPTGTSVTDTIPRGTTYWYYVKAVNTCGAQGPPSNIVSVTRP